MSIWKNKYIGIIILLLIFGFIFKRVAADWDKIVASPLKVNYTDLGFSYIGLCTVYILCAFLWRQILNRFQDGLVLLNGLKIWLYSQLGKYLPGKGFVYLGRTFLSKKYGIDNKNSFASSAVEVGLQLLSAFILILIAIPFITNFPSFLYQWWIILFVFLGLVIMHPRLFTFGVNKVLSLFKKEKIELNMTYLDMVCNLFMYLFIQFIAGFSFFFFARAFYFTPIKNAPFIGMSFIIAYIVGALSALAPAGLGIREGILLILLNKIMPPAAVIQVALFSRLWVISVDLMGAGAALVLDKAWIGKNKNQFKI